MTGVYINIAKCSNEVSAFRTEAYYQHLKFEYNLLEGRIIVIAQRQVAQLSLLSSTQKWFKIL